MPFGLRPSLRDKARRFGADGYSVLVPNPFLQDLEISVHRCFEVHTFRMRTIWRNASLMASVTAWGRLRRRSGLCWRFLDSQKE